MNFKYEISQNYINEMSRGSTIIICWTGILNRGIGWPAKKWPRPAGGTGGGGGWGGGSPRDAGGLAAPPTLPAICVSRFKVTGILMIPIDHTNLKIHRVYSITLQY